MRKIIKKLGQQPIEEDVKAIRAYLNTATITNSISDGGGIDLVPGTLTASTVNEISGGIIRHAIDNSSDPGASKRILSTGSSGKVSIKELDIKTDGTNYTNIFVSGSGTYTVRPFGTSPGMQVNSGLIVQGDVQSSGGDLIATSGVLDVTSTAAYQARLSYDGSNYADFTVNSGGGLTIELDNGTVAQYEVAVFGALAVSSFNGNARGPGAVDLQPFRTLATQVAGGSYSVVGGGVNNTAQNSKCVVAGGDSNVASVDTSVVSGGKDNTASAIMAVISGGLGNTVTDNYSLVAGGQANTVSGAYSAVGGGSNNTASGDYATVSGGQNGTALGGWAAVAGGINNVASANYSGVFAGHLNEVSAVDSVILGGLSNEANGQYSAVLAGQDNVASGDFSFAAGYRANSNLHNGSFVFSDRSDTGTTNFNAIAANTVNFRATGGLNLAYDNTHRTVFTTSSAGDLTIAPTGGDVNVTGNIAVTGTVEG